jgi:predicted amidophosphoribosyltransferase
MSSLALCATCARPLRRSEQTCPFCAARIERPPVARIVLKPAQTCAALLEHFTWVAAEGRRGA